MGYFFDSYAIVEIILGNENYKKFEDSTIVTSTINLAEVYYFLLREYNERTADYWIKKMNFHLVNIIKLDSVVKASKFRFENKDEQLSYADCLGYILAKELNLEFLTGDIKFKNKKNVEFVK